MGFAGGQVAFQNPVGGEVGVDRCVVIHFVGERPVSQDAGAAVLGAVRQRIEADFVTGLARVSWVEYPKGVIRFCRRKIGFNGIALAGDCASE